MLTLIEQKIKRQIELGAKPKILFLDLDGTIFKENYEIIFAPFFNLQTLKLLKNNSIPFCIVTGRLFWNNLSEIEMYLHGLPKPDAIILKDGAEIIFRNKNNKLENDTFFLKDKKTIPDNLFKMDNLKFKKIDPYLYVSHINNLNVKKLLEIKSYTQNTYKNLWNLSFSESLRRKNTKDNFSGTLFLKDKNLGKHTAIRYLLSVIENKIKEKIDVFIFGDASVDVPMLSLKGNNIHSFLVNPKPLAKNLALKNKKIKIILTSGPKAILEILKTTVLTDGIIDSKKHLSKAQNNPMRKIILFLEPMLNKIIDSKLSPNDISLLGLNKTTRGLDLIYASKNKFKQFYGLYLFLFGNFIDLLDGIRARSENKNKKLKNNSNYNNLDGQIVDVFCDRFKEFYFFYKKPKPANILANQPDHALSCILPSIARTANEILNQTVSEKDEKKGSMLDRIFLMFKSIYFYALGFSEISQKIDNKIYLNNLETFKNRIKKINYERLNDSHYKIINKFQKNALIRLKFLLKLYNVELEFYDKKIENKLISFQINRLQSLPILAFINIKKEEKLFELFKKIT